MKYLMSFLSGVFVGATAALLFAPKSGAELREQIRLGAEAELQRVEAEWRAASAKLNVKIDEMSQQLKALVEQAEEQEEAEAEPTA
jgi:gas vesicle protein